MTANNTGLAAHNIAKTAITYELYGPENVAMSTYSWFILLDQTPFFRVFTID